MLYKRANSGDSSRALLSLGLGLSLVMVLYLSACRTVDSRRNERAKRATPAETQLRQRAMRALGEERVAAEIAAWQNLLQRFPHGAYTGQALMRLGVLAYRQTRLAKACRYFAKSQKHALNLQEQRYVLLFYARALAKRKAHAKLQQALGAQYKKMFRADQKEVLGYLIKAGLHSKHHAKVFRWRWHLYDLTPLKKRRRLRSQLIRMMPSLTRAELKALLQEAGQRRLRFPLDYAAFRLAQAHYEHDKFKKSAAVLAVLRPQLAIGHRLYKRVNDMYDEVKEARRPAKPLHIGVIYPQSGKASTLGLHIRRSVELALQYYPQIKIFYRDSASSPQRSVSAVNELVRRYKVIAILGPPLRATAEAAAKQAQKLGVPLISITTSEKFTEIGDYIFRNNITLSRMGAAIARYAHNVLHIQRLGVLYSADHYGRTQANAYTKEAKRLGAIVDGTMEYDPYADNHQFAIRMLLGTRFANGQILQQARQKMKQLKGFERKRLRNKVYKLLKPLVPFEGLFIAAPAKLASQLAAYLAFYNVGMKRTSFAPEYGSSSFRMSFRRIRLLGNNAWLNPDLFVAGERYVKGAILCVRYNPLSRAPAAQQFTLSYEQRYNKKPVHISAYSYDAMRLLADIASRGKARTHARFRNTLKQIKKFPGATGPLRVTPKGEIQGPFHFLVAHRKKFHYHGTMR